MSASLAATIMINLFMIILGLQFVFVCLTYKQQTVLINRAKRFVSKFQAYPYRRRAYYVLSYTIPAIKR